MMSNAAAPIQTGLKLTDAMPATLANAERTKTMAASIAAVFHWRTSFSVCLKEARLGSIATA